MQTAGDHDYKFQILEAVEAVNEAQKSYLFQKIDKHYGGDLSGKHFAVWGLAFKPNVALVSGHRCCWINSPLLYDPSFYVG